MYALTTYRADDSAAWRERLARVLDDAAATHALRAAALALGDGTDWSRCDDHQVLDQLAWAMRHGRLAATAPIDGLLVADGALGAPKLRRLVKSAPLPAPPPAPAPSSARASAPAPAPAPVETTFNAQLDVAAMVATLSQAARDGVPFCEECERARQRQAAAT